MSCVFDNIYMFLIIVSEILQEDGSDAIKVIVCNPASKKVCVGLLKTDVSSSPKNHLY